jgi:drug/metabolite transporter (DMT)-like permease
VGISVICYAAGSLIVQRHLHAVDELGAVALSVAASSVALLPIALWSGPIPEPAFQAWSAVIVLGIVCTALGLLLYFYLIRAAGAARATVVTYINPAVAALLGVLVLDEHLGLGSTLGLVLILCGSWLATSRRPAVLARSVGR